MRKVGKVKNLEARNVRVTVTQQLNGAEELSPLCLLDLHSFNDGRI